MRFDHAVLAVRNLDQAKAHFEALGFTTYYGGEHAGGQTHNQLIVFKDGSYLELMAPTRRAELENAPQVEGSFLPLIREGEGFIGYAVHTDDLDLAVEAMQAGGISLGEPQEGSRRKPDGKTIAWRMAAIPQSMSPFFMTDTTPRVLRVPDSVELTTHPNGATGYAGIAVVVPEIEAAIRKYRAILAASGFLQPSVVGAGSAAFALGSTLITLAVPGTDGSLASQLQLRGESPYRIRLYTGEAEWFGLLDPAFTHGGRIELVPGG